VWFHSPGFARRLGLRRFSWTSWLLPGTDTGAYKLALVLLPTPLAWLRAIADRGGVCRYNAVTDLAALRILLRKGMAATGTARARSVSVRGFRTVDECVSVCRHARLVRR
jgi:hypothetical protein